MRKYSVTVHLKILRCVRTMMIIKNASLVQLKIRKHGSLCLIYDCRDQRYEREFLILAKLHEKGVGQAVKGSQTCWHRTGKNTFVILDKTKFCPQITLLLSTAKTTAAFQFTWPRLHLSFGKQMLPTWHDSVAITSDNCFWV